jgi:hypothetical protein
METNIHSIQIGGSKKIIIIIIVVVIVFAIIFGVIGYLVFRKKNSLSPPGPQIYTPPSSPSPSPPSPGNGLWVRNPGAGYINGLDYSDSATYCAGNNATLATVDQLTTAGTLGFNYCTAGWLANQNAGYTVTNASAACGNQGFNQWPGSDPTAKLATYCYGPIPTTSEVGSSIVMSST